jgi:hypothetical protein
MILGPATPDAPADAERSTLDDLFQRAAGRRPDAIAIVDTPSRENFTDGAPRQLTYAEADRMVSAIAGRLKRLGLPHDSVVAVQLPNTVEHALTLLGVLRAGLIASPLPLLWRRRDMHAALTLVGARALITCSRVETTDHCELAMNVAAEAFTIRHICAFGPTVPDGFVPLEDLYAKTDGAVEPVRVIERLGNPADHVALITWDADVTGLVPVARKHSELLAGGFSVFAEAALGQDAVILSTLQGSSFAGLATVLVPWLISGGTLVLHQPFDAAVLNAQRAEHQCSTIVLPGPLATRLADARLVGARDGLTSMIGVWRAPERMLVSPTWREPNVRLIDVQALGEVGIIAGRRGADGHPALIGPGRLITPRGTPGAVVVAELARSRDGTLLMRGPMVPRHPFPPGIERTGTSYLRVGDDGFVDTGYTCRIDRDSGRLMVTRPPAGMVSVGGYRFLLRELQDIVAATGPGATLAGLPDTISGHRLAGSAPNRDALIAELIDLGLNPLVANAFRDRRAAETPPISQASAA